MRDEEIEKRLANIAIHAEAEKALRQCRSYIERLRHEKKLGCTDSPPSWIDKKYLEIYVAKAKQLRRSRKIKLEGGDSGMHTKKYYMTPANTVPGPFNLLTIAEIAIKSGQTTKKIRYLCLNGRVPYLPGEPRLIDEVDVTKYFERKRVAQLARIPPTPGTPEYEALQWQRARERKILKARRIRVRQEVARIVADIEARKAAGTWIEPGSRKRRR